MVLSNGTVLRYVSGVDPRHKLYQTLIFEGSSLLGFFSISDQEKQVIERICSSIIRRKMPHIGKVSIKLVRASPSFSLVLSGSTPNYTMTLHVMMEIQGEKE